MVRNVCFSQIKILTPFLFNSYVENQPLEYKAQ